MTIQVTIRHNQPDYPHDIKVTVCDVDGVKRDYPGAERVLQGGDDGIFWIHRHQQLRVEEVLPTGQSGPEAGSQE
jgi:hypothetical protein